MDYIDFFLNSKSSIVQLECLEISHPSFSKTYRVVRNATLGIQVKHENGEVFDYKYYPLSIASKGDTDDLDQGYQISLGDLGEDIPKEVDKVEEANSFLIKPRVMYRAYRSDDLNHVLIGPTVLEIKAFSFNNEGASFTALAPQLNISSTGEIYDLSRFDALRGTL